LLVSLFRGDGIDDVRFIAVMGRVGAKADAINRVATGFLKSCIQQVIVG